MDLKTFVSESLSQILAGVREAQSKDGGNDVAAEGYLRSQGNLMDGGVSGYFTLVDFDVSVFIETKEGRDAVRVASVEVSSPDVRTSQNTSRVKFSVPVRLPKGGAARDHGFSERDFSGDDESWMTS